MRIGVRLCFAKSLLMKIGLVLSAGSAGSMTTSERSRAAKKGWATRRRQAKR